MVLSFLGLLVLLFFYCLAGNAKDSEGSMNGDPLQKSDCRAEESLPVITQTLKIIVVEVYPLSGTLQRKRVQKEELLAGHVLAGKERLV